MDSVELSLAFTWICPNCRKRNYANSVAVELTDESRRELIEKYADEDPDTIEDDLVKEPAIVTCCKCLTKFETVADDDEEDEDDINDADYWKKGESENFEDKL